MLAATTAAAALALAASPAAAQERQYELVSPADDGIYHAKYRTADPDLNRVYYEAGLNPGSPVVARPDGVAQDIFGATRTSQAWEVSWLSPYCPGKFSVNDAGACEGEREGLGTEFAGARNGRVTFYDQAPIPPGKPGFDITNPASNPTTELYSGAAQTTALLGWPSPPAPADWGAGLDPDGWVATSPDQTMVAFSSSDARVPEAAGLQAGLHLYVRRGGTLELASAPVAGATGGCTGSCVVGTLSLSAKTFGMAWQSPGVAHVVSDDGQRVFFRTTRQLHPDATAGRHEVYVLDGDQLRLLSDGLVNPAGAGANSSFEWASADGSRAFIATGIVGNTTLVSSGRLWAVDVPGETAVAMTPAGVTARFVWASDDGSTALVRSTDSFADAPAVAGDKLYVWRDGAGASYVGPIGAGSTLVEEQPAWRDVRGTVDGSTIVFGTKAGLDPADTNGAADLYRLRGGTLTWLTPRAGAAAAGDIAMSYLPSGAGTGSDFDHQYPRGLTADASTVFFTAAASLTDGDTDGGKADVYSVRDGEYELITPAGDAQLDAWLNEHNADGSIVLFSGYEQVTEIDTDPTMVDIYSARTSGAFADKLPPGTTGAPPAAAGSGVAAPVPSAPSEAPSPSVEPLPEVPEWPEDPGTQGGSGDARGELALVDDTVKGGKRRLVFGLELPSAGELRVKLRGQVAGKRGSKVRTIARGTKDVAHDGTQRVKLRLTRAGRRFMRGHGGDEVALRVVFVGEGGDRLRLRERLSVERPKDRAAARREARDA